MNIRRLTIFVVFWLAACVCVQAEPDQLADARQALFVTSNLDAARASAGSVLKTDAGNVEALFIEMEAAALQADTRAELEAALRLCETRASDPRVNIAAARIRELAANTAEFRAVLPRVQVLIAAGNSETSSLRAALVAAAADGLPGLSLLDLAHGSGLLTDWRIAGPFGKFSNVDFERRWPPEQDQAAQRAYDGRIVERFRFQNGAVELPDYFPRAGVVYAASDVTVPTGGSWLLRIESPGTLEVLIDGATLLTKDTRFRVAPETSSHTVSLAAGTHRIVVKFILSATPFKVALLRQEQKRKTEPAITFGPEASYVAAAEKYWTRDYAAAISGLESLRSQHPSAAVSYLLARAWTHADPDSPEAAALLNAATKLAPTATAAEYDLAARAYAEGREQEALNRARQVIAARPEFAPGQDLMTQIAVSVDWHADALHAMEARLRLHPSCSTLREAAKLFSSAAQYARASQVETELQNCAPGSLDFANALSEQGRHAEAARAAAAVVAENPLDRESRALLAQELALTGQFEAARNAAEELVKLAPNSEPYRRLAAAVASGGVLDEQGWRTRQFALPAFYAPYQRDALKIMEATANRGFVGGSAATLLYDRVVKVEKDGSATQYVHKLTRLLNRDGIERYGEVTLPGGAEILELRTIKSDGTIAEPEPTRHKATVSMPALAPGDVIEQEYLQRFSQGSWVHADAFQFVFGLFTAPVIYSRFVVLWPTAELARMHVSAYGTAPQPQDRNLGDLTERIWERNDIPQSFQESAMPRRDTLPTVRVFRAATGWGEIRDLERDVAIEAVRIGSRAEQVAAALRGHTDEERARDVYRDVVARIRPSGTPLGSEETISAEDTLADHAGSRTAALLAVAHAAGLKADLMLARDVGASTPQAAQLDAYTRPLVRFRFPGSRPNEVVVDAETEGMAFGGLPPTIERGDALLVPIEKGPDQKAESIIVRLPDSVAAEQSVAEGDVTLDASGRLQARISIRMGATRAAQMRSVLAGIDPSQRQHFFEQLALRIFPGAAGAGGEVRNEYDLERPLEIIVTCGAPRFINVSAGVADIDQLVPALGLRKMYGAGSRRFPLYIDAPLFETATFHIRLPHGISVSRRPADLVLQNEFGDYSVTFQQPRPDQLDIRRSFRIPVQVVAPNRFGFFSQFAMQIDEAERQRITLHKDNLAASN